MTEPRRPEHSMPPDRAFIWMVMVAGGVLTLGGSGLTAVSLIDHDGRAVLWIVFTTIGLIGVAFGVRTVAQRGRH